MRSIINSIIKYDKKYNEDYKLLVKSWNIKPNVEEEKYWHEIMMNDNPGLTEYKNKYMKLHPIYRPHFIYDFKEWFDEPSLSDNIDPKMANTIILNQDNLDWNKISENPNPGLTEFIKENIRRVNKQRLCKNTNPELAELIIEINENY